MNTILNDITQEFLKEAFLSPRMLEDIASLERYNAESYDGKIITELLQNSDDSNSSDLIILKLSNAIIVANNGREFNEADVRSISRSGASQKNRNESIGYRGIGFKSSVALSTEIVIYSGEFCFTFSKSYCSKVIGIDIDKTPTIRIPFEYPVDKIQKTIKDKIDILKNKGYTTFFIFNEPNYQKFGIEVSHIKNDYLIFLRTLVSIHIEYDDLIQNFHIDKQQNKNVETVGFSNNDSWRIFNKGNISIAFMRNNNLDFIPSINPAETLYSYLPTEEIAGYAYKINADFHTDPSRKHLIYDDNSNQIIKRIAEYCVEIIMEMLPDNAHLAMQILKIVTAKTAISTFSVKLESVLFEKLSNSKIILFENNEIKSPHEYTLLPDYFSSAEKDLIIENCKYFKDNSITSSCKDLNPELESLLKTFGAGVYPREDMVFYISSINFASKIDNAVLGGIHAKLIGQVENYSCFNDFYVPVSNHYEKISNCNNQYLDKDYLSGLENALTSEKYEQFISYFDLKVSSKKNPFSRFSVVSNEYSTSATQHKWRTSEEISIGIEKELGFTAIDVSKQNLGYDVKSITNDGKSRYIEVKSVDTMGDSFAITNNEYTAAHQYGKDYFICLINQKEDGIDAVYIQDPINSLFFEKRVRSWEWLCDKYNGKLIHIE